MADPAAGKRSKLALHWKILIGLVLGVVVGVAVNLGFTDARWASLGVSDPDAYLAGKKNSLTAPRPSDLEAAADVFRAAAPERGVSSEELPSDEASRGDVLDAMAWMLQDVPLAGTRIDFEQPLSDWTVARHAWVMKELDRMQDADWAADVTRFRLERGVDELTQRSYFREWIVGDPVRESLDSLIDPNRNAGFAAGVVKLVSKLNGFIGDLFIRMLQFIAVPIVLFSLIVGAASLNDIKKLSRIGGKTIVIYLCTTAVAITVGLAVANAVKPGSSRFVPAEIRDQLATDRAAEAGAKIEAAVKPDVWETFLNIVPTNPFGALAEGNMLQIVFAAMAIGIALTLIPQGKAKPVIVVCDAMTDVIIKVVHVVMLTAPYAVFALIAGVVAELGLGVLQALAVYSLVVVFGLAVMMFGVYPLVLRVFTPVGYKRFFSAIAPAQLLAFSSSSSSATLPVTMDCVENRLGASEDVTSFVVPLGATINMDGTALYQGVAAVFIAQLYGLDLSIGQQLTIVLTATLASIGTAGVPGVGMIMLVIVLQSIGMSADVMAGGIAIIFGVDRVLDMCRTTCNVTGDTMVAAVVASSESELATPEQMAERAAALDEFTKTDEDREKAYE